MVALVKVVVVICKNLTPLFVRVVLRYWMYPGGSSEGGGGGGDVIGVKVDTKILYVG